MQIVDNTWVRLAFELLGEDGQLLESGDQLTYLHGGYGMIFSPAEQALLNKQVGDLVEVQIKPQDGFGFYDTTLMKVEPRSLFPEHVHEGMMFEGKDEESDGLIFVYRVTDVDDEQVIVDANHPYAGMTLTLKATVMELRAATEEEIAQHTVFDQL